MSETQMPPTYTDVVIVGGGPAGLAMALSLDAMGVASVVLERSPWETWENAPFDGREIALTHRSARLLQTMHVWNRLPENSVAELKEAQVENARGGEPLVFDTNGTGEEALGYLVSNHLIRRALFAECQSRSHITLKAGKTVEDVKTSPINATVTDADGEVLHARLIIAADGRFSQVREKQGIGAILHDFHRTMMVFRMTHEKPHHHIALQWFDQGQTFAFLPMNGNMSSIVFTLSTDEMEQMRQMEDEAFTQEVMCRVGYRLGNMELVSSRHAYPLKGVYAHRFWGRRLALIGDAAVGMHPITAHGFNLGLVGQDILAEEIGSALSKGRDIGSLSVVQRFSLRHRMASTALFAITNGIAVVYAREELPFRLVRKIGISVAEHMGPLKGMVTKMLMDETGPIPAEM
ncbi:5-demethoxyubiquinol-8 5-hydroxylase UbiM [Entomobacter blattae]|uniref:2-octaprenylphenol hydroxylase n=1 Tax=Entomobacter blattae TaxID=2762277 RepID=A0A7H1NUM4_9PROT|nr:5-demethoxyubiquinol-8 5-hydroxylase UbiM [Entomobacter blattae]QNT79484.1 2-octaprenylphenol hydroxylase [Entomobacter blattae]